MAVGILKIGLSILFANALRFLRIIPNNDPIMGIMLPVSKQNSLLAAIAFPVITMVTFDIVTASVGLWTIATSATYGALGLFFYFYYKKLTKAKKKIGLKTYLGSGVFGVLVFDFVTGVLMMPLLFGYTFVQAFIGQIPFTLLHLATVAGYTIILTPLLDKHLMQNPAIDGRKLLESLARMFPRMN